MRPLKARINLTALDANLAQVRSLVSGRTKLVAVIKANAYGHGICQIARHLSGKVSMLAVASIDEAQRLRQSGITAKILLLQGMFHPDECELIRHNAFTPVIHSQHQYDWLRQAGLPPQLWVKLETGMRRLGFGALPAGLKELTSSSDMTNLILMHHYACADTPDNPLNALQRDNFIRQSEGVRGSGWQTSCANSAVICGQKNSATAMPPGEYIRPGIMLYGASPLVGVACASLGLQPVMQLESQLIACTPVTAGETIGYGATFTAPTNGYTGVVACGFGDGYPREFHALGTSPGTAYALVNDKMCSIAGRVSMDMLTLWLGESPQPVGSKVILWGDNPSVDQVAEWVGTIPYTLLTGITSRVPREYSAVDTL